MAKSKKRLSAASSVPKVALHQVSLSLQDLPEKPKESWSLREAVDLLQEPLTTALNRGYSYEEIVGILGKNGMQITASSLKRYLAVAKRAKDDSKPKTRRGTRRKSGAESAAVSSPEPEPSLASRVAANASSEAAPTRKRRMRSSSAQPETETTAKPETKRAAKSKSTTRTRTSAPRSGRKGKGAF